MDQAMFCLGPPVFDQIYHTQRIPKLYEIGYNNRQEKINYRPAYI